MGVTRYQTSCLGVVYCRRSHYMTYLTTLRTITDGGAGDDHNEYNNSNDVQHPHKYLSLTSLRVYKAVDEPSNIMTMLPAKLEATKAHNSQPPFSTQATTPLTLLPASRPSPPPLRRLFSWQTVYLLSHGNPFMAAHSFVSASDVRGPGAGRSGWRMSQVCPWKKKSREVFVTCRGRLKHCCLALPCVSCKYCSLLRSEDIFTAQEESSDGKTLFKR